MAIRESDAPGDEALPAVDAVIIGAGFAGLYAHHRLRRLGIRIRGFEAAPDVGGTWFWNGYPGARCDVESLDYAYSFSPELLDDWIWSERFATQPEILRYINHVTDRFDLRRDIDFDTTVVSGSFDEAANRWSLETSAGQRISTRFVVTAVGCLSARILPDFPGLEEFRGRLVQTSAWPREGVDLKGKRVGVVGTGSSGIQAIPRIAEQAAHLTVFQRTPNFSLPAKNGPIDPQLEESARADYPDYCQRNKATPAGYQVHLPAEMPAGWLPGRSALAASDAEREAVLETLWSFGGTGFTSAYTDFTTDIDANHIAADFVHRKIRQIVKDPAVAEKLCPTDHPFATKRLCLDTDYYATFNRPNVTLVDIRATPIERVTPTGLRTSEQEYPLDLLVFATGFDAVTGPLLRLNLTGAGGARLEEEWAQGPRSYFGLMIARFPNLFTVTGPGSPSVLTNMMPSVEQHVDWIAECLEHLHEQGLDGIEADPEAQEGWAAEVQAAASHSLFLKAKSWYMGANVEGKPRTILPYMGGFSNYADRCADVARAGYRGFRLSRQNAEPGSAANSSKDGDGHDFR